MIQAEIQYTPQYRTQQLYHDNQQEVREQGLLKPKKIKTYFTYIVPCNFHAYIAKYKSDYVDNHIFSIFSTIMLEMASSER